MPNTPHIMRRSVAQAAQMRPTRRTPIAPYHHRLAPSYSTGSGLLIALVLLLVSWFWVEVIFYL